MHAAYYEKLGDADLVIQSGEVPEPHAGVGEVRVRVYASGVNPSDVKRRAGKLSSLMPFPRIIPHNDGAGVIDQIGSGISPRRLGERVWIHNGQWQRPFGTAAQYIVLPADLAVPLPQGTSFPAAACLGVPAMTAHRCLFADGPVRGKTVLVTGGSGAVGLYAVQLAVWGGATVIATVSSKEKAAHARAAGAHHIINYKTDSVAEHVMALTEGRGVARIVEVDLGGNLKTSVTVIQPGGVISVYASAGDPQPALPVLPLMFKNATLRMVLVYDIPDAAKVQAREDINTWLASGSAQHLIAARFPLSQLAAAHKLQESGQAIGNIVLELDSDAG